MKKKVLQKIADYIIHKLETSNDKDTFHFYYDMGLMLDHFVMYYFNVELE